jgi:hypothetical protein
VTDGSARLPGGTVVIAPTLKYLERAYDASKYGRSLDSRTRSHGLGNDRVDSLPVRTTMVPATGARGAVNSSALRSTRCLTFPGIRPFDPADRGARRSTLSRAGVHRGDLNHGQLISISRSSCAPRPAGRITARRRRLFLCGSGGHGGGISGAAGRNAAPDPKGTRPIGPLAAQLGDGVGLE